MKTPQDGQGRVDPLSDAKIVDSWRTHAEPWTTAVRGGEIASRKLVTDDAIIEAVLARKPGTVLDIGCGEGWLARALASHGVRVTGVDVVPALIEAARQMGTAGGPEFRVASYEEIAAGLLQLTADVIVANFSLLGKESVESVIGVAPSLLRPRGAVIVQTLHPLMASADLPYEDGWRAGTWAGFSASFRDPAPWYFRTIESWIRLLVTSGLNVAEVREPLDPRTQKPASIVFVAEATG